MQLHTIQGTKTKSKKRVGRGGKRGTYSGKGHKGQKARAGRKIRPAERDIISKFAKFRGSRNTKRAVSATTIQVHLLPVISDGKVINKKLLVKKGILDKVTNPVKIVLGREELSEKVAVSGIPASKKAIEAIEAKGGTIK